MRGAIELGCNSSYEPVKWTLLFHFRCFPYEPSRPCSLRQIMVSCMSTRLNGPQPWVEWSRPYLYRFTRRRLTHFPSRWAKTCHWAQTTTHQKWHPLIFIRYTFSSMTATVLIELPSKALTWTAPVPTIPKLAAEPTAKILAEWGDHFMLVMAWFSWTANWRKDCYMGKSFGMM